MPLIACADSVTELRGIREHVLVAGSHGGIIAARRHRQGRSRHRRIALARGDRHGRRLGGSWQRAHRRRKRHARARPALAVRLLKARAFQHPVPDYREGRVLLSPGVWGLDSVGMVEPEDRGRILVIGSHAALHGGRAQSALSVDAAFALFNDAGGVVSRLGALDVRGVPAAAVDCMSARIGDCRSMWDTGVVSHVNASAKFARPGMPVREAIAAMR
jgi:hypothetical protein